jgi:hypothetical protein
MTAEKCDRCGPQHEDRRSGSDWVFRSVGVRTHHRHGYVAAATMSCSVGLLVTYPLSATFGFKYRRFTDQRLELHMEFYCSPSVSFR